MTKLTETINDIAPYVFFVCLAIGCFTVAIAVGASIPWPVH